MTEVAFTDGFAEEIVIFSRTLISRGVGQDAAAEFSGFFSEMAPNMMRCPASSSVSRHQAYSGGLMQHSCEVFIVACRAMSAARGWSPKISAADAANAFVAAMLHDLNKVTDFAGRSLYIPNVLKAGNISEKKPYSRNPEFLKPSEPPGDSEESRFARAMVSAWAGQISEGWISAEIAETRRPGMLSKFSPDVRQAIEIHDGGYSARRSSHSGSESTLAIAIHFADMISSRGDLSGSILMDPTLFWGYIPEIDDFP